MASTEAQDANSSVIQNAEREASARANKITIKQLTSRISEDPGVDLSEILKQQAVSYPQIRKILAEAARQQPLANLAADSNPVPTPADIRQTVLIPPLFQIIYPLQGLVVDLATLQLPSLAEVLHRGPLDHVDDRMIAALNETIKNGEVLSELGGTVVLGLDSSVAVKIGRSIDIAHIATLQHVQAHAPEVPTPDTLGLIKAGQQTYFFMSRKPDVSLDIIWPKLSHSQKINLQQQLNSIFKALRSIPRPQASADSAIGGGDPFSCKDLRRSERVASVIIKNEEEFNDFLCTELGRSKTPWIEMIRSSMREDHSIVMTHGDLHPRNIMVTVGEAAYSYGRSMHVNQDQDIKITSILDWEMSGWYPDYWEFVKSLNTINPGNALGDWRDFLPTEAIGAWPVEFAIDKLISQWLG